MEYCEKCKSYGIDHQELRKKELQPLEVKKKLQTSKEFLPSLYIFVYTWYNYFECPICHWWKFKQKEA
jgi:hypothetical protein